MPAPHAASGGSPPNHTTSDGAARNVGIIRQHVPALDGLRGLAALMVMFFHFPWPKPNNAIEHVMFRSTRLGQTGVDLFFVLSGFLITGILLGSRESPHYFRNFYMRRILRIFPLYYGVVIAGLLIAPLLAHEHVIWARLGTFLVYGWNVAYTFHPAAWTKLTPPYQPGHFWSLCVEEHFYLLWPFLVYSLDRKHLPRVLFSFIGASILIRIVMEHFGYSVFYFTLCRLDALSMGALLAVWFPDPAEMRRYVRPATIGLLTTIIVGTPLYIWLSGKHLAIVQDFKFTAIAFLYMCALVVVVGGQEKSPVSRFFTSRLLRWFGAISYGMYVFHPFVYRTVDWALGRLGGRGHYAAMSGLFWAYLVGSFSLTFLVAFLSWKLYEQPILRLKRRFPAGNGEPAAKAA